MRRDTAPVIGWQDGTPRKYTDPAIADRIRTLKKYRNQHRYLVGNEYVLMDYDNQFGPPLPSRWYVDQVVRDADLQIKKPKPEKRERSAEYLLYPNESMKRLGEVQESADFIGKKYIAGRSEPVNIFSASYYTPWKLFQMQRILAEKAVYVIPILKEQWVKYPVPNVFRFDNGLQWRGTARGKRCLGMMLRFLLNLGITPLFGAPSKPWTNPHIEGHNRVFNEKVWGQNWFTSLEQIDKECGRFNAESLEYFHYKYSQTVFNGDYRYLEKNQEVDTERLAGKKGKKIYFVRFVESLDADTKSHIVILNETVRLPEKFNHQFVFVEWNIEKERLYVFSEYQTVATLIAEFKFTLNW